MFIYVCRDQLWAEVKKIGLVEGTGGGHNSDHSHPKITRKEDEWNIMQCVASSCYMHAARLCGGHDTVYRSLPYYTPLVASGTVTNDTTDTIQLQRWGTGGDVTLLHPQANSALAFSPHPSPAYVVYQELVFSGRASMRHVCAVDLSVLDKHRAAYKLVQPDQLSGVKLLPSPPPVPVPEPEISSSSSGSSGTKRKPTSDPTPKSNSTLTNSQILTTQTSTTATVSTTDSIASSSNSNIVVGAATGPSAADLARDRYLARKKQLK